MPATLISTREGWIQTVEPLLDAVQNALADTIGVNRESRALRLQQFPADSFTLPRGKGDHYTMVEITLLPSRTVEQKQALYAALANRLAPFGIPAGDLKVILYDIPAENWN